MRRLPIVKRESFLRIAVKIKEYLDLRAPWDEVILFQIRGNDGEGFAYELRASVFSKEEVARINEFVKSWKTPKVKPKKSRPRK